MGRIKALTFALAVTASAASAHAQTPIPVGRHDAQVTVDGLTRRFVVHVPAQVDGRTRVPLVVMLHGTSGSGGKFYAISGWTEKADAEGFIAVFPSALSQCVADDDDGDGQFSPAEYHVTTKWASGELGTASLRECTDAELARFPAAQRAEVETRTVPDDVAFIRAMVAALQRDLPIDPSRMYVSGFSNGGQMSGRLMVEASDTFAAFAMAAGGLSIPGPALRPEPAVFTVGSLDDRFLALTGLSELPTDPAGMAAVPLLLSMSVRLCNVLSLDVQQHADQQTRVNGADVGLVTFDHSLVGASNALHVAVIGGATHEYPNGTNHPVVMADLLWGFFRQYTLRP